MNKLISIIMPCKNGSKYLEEALKAIQKQNMNVEVILIDDGSTDNTSEIAKSYGCKVIRNEASVGPVKGKNAALKIAMGDFIMFHDHDDVMQEGALKRLYDELECSPEYAAVEAKVKDFLSPELSEEEKQKTTCKPEPYWGLFTGAILMKKAVWDIFGGFSEEVTAGEIIDWQGKMDANGFKVKKIDFVSTNRRLHTTNFGKTQQKTEFKDYAALLRAKIRAQNQGQSVSTQITDKFRSNSFKNERKQLSDEEHKKNIEVLLSNLDEEAYKHGLNLVEKLEKTYDKPFISIENIYSAEELKVLEEVKKFESSIQKVENGYKWEDYILPIKLFESSVFFHRHGLDRLKTKDQVKDKAIIDAGCYIADSALVFRHEFPDAPIYGFEPLKSNFELAQKTVSLNNLKNIIMENKGLGEAETTLKMKTYDTDLKNIESTICTEGNQDVEITTIDAYVKEHGLKVGLIKTDVEGFEPQLLQGAKQTICEQKPILLISIYHNYNDFYKIKPLIESWNLGYKFDFFQGVQNAGNIVVETLLIAEQY